MAIQTIKITLNTKDPYDALIMDYLLDKRPAAVHLKRLAYDRLSNAGGGSQPAAVVLVPSTLQQAGVRPNGPTAKTETKGEVDKGDENLSRLDSEDELKGGPTWSISRGLQ
jgi:hypothetical protein